MNVDLAVQMAYALGIGLLVGLERTLVQLTTGQEQEPSEEASESDPERADGRRAPDDFPGVRTFAVFSLVGYVSALVGEQIPFLGPVALGGVIALVVAMYIRAAQFGFGITTEAAGVCTCLLGMLCRHNTQAAGVLALLLTVLLASKRFTHDMVRKMRRVELTDTLKFLVVILIVLPLLPREPIDPYGVVNPYKIGFLVVLISGISFVGYFLTRILGARRGLGLTGVLGGLTSSTAVTAAMAAEARQRPGLGAICAFSTVAANAAMFLRVLVVVAVLDRALALRLAWGIGTMTLVATVASVVLWLRASRRGGDGDASTEVPLKNPFSVWPAVKRGDYDPDSDEPDEPFREKVRSFLVGLVSRNRVDSD